MNDAADYFGSSDNDKNWKDNGWEYKGVNDSKTTPYVSAVVAYLALEWGMSGPAMTEQAITNIISLATQIGNVGIRVPVPNAAAAIMELFWSQGMIRPDFDSEW